MLAILIAASPAWAAPAPDTLAGGLTPLQRIVQAEDQRVPAAELDGALRADDAELRRRAALAVGRLQDSTGTALLLPLLTDPDPEVRREAVFALGQIGLAHPGAPAPARVALEGLLADGDAETAVLAAEALGKLGDRSATPALARLLGHPAPMLRGAAAVALWRLADSTALGPLLARHDDPDPGVRWRVLYALERIPRPDQVVLIAALHLDDAEWLSRAYAARTIGRQKSPLGTAYLIQKLTDPEVGVVVNAIRGLQQIADSSCATCLASLAGGLDAPHPYVRVTAATALAERSPWDAADSLARRAALEKVQAHLDDPDASTRGACARVMAARRVWDATALVAMLSDSSVYARAAVLQAMTLLPAEDAVPFLRGRIRPRVALLERMTAAEALGTLRAPQAAGDLRGALEDTSVMFVGAAAAALAEMGDASAVPALARALAAHAGDADADTRVSLRDALRALAGTRVADSLERAHPAAPAPVPGGADLFTVPEVKGAVLHTTKGDIEWAFFREEAPQTVKNYARLAARGYFDGLALHRVVPNFVVQDGDPSGTGSGGPGWTIRCEYNRLRYEPGMVGMALSGKDTGGSQWFITHSPQPHLDGRYTIFARVTKGMDVVGRLVQGDRVRKVDLLR